jgi:putative peptidoglycan lipid II flippase
MLPAIIGLSATEINIFVNTFFASSCAEGSVSWLNYAFRLVMFPIGLAGVSLSIATLPVVSNHASRGDMTQLREAYISSTSLCLILTIPASMGLIFLAKPIVRLIFEHGRFSSFDTMNTAYALAFYSVGLFAYSAIKIIVPVFYALNKTRYPVLGSFVTVILNIFFIVLLMKPLQHKAIALSTSLCVIANFLFLSIVLYREIKGYPIVHLLGTLFKTTGVAVVMGVLGWWLNKNLEHTMGTGVIAQSFSLFIVIICSGIFYFWMLNVLKIKEVHYLISKIQRQFNKSQH